MSTEEQDAAIGRLVRERAEANRQRALLEQEIKKYPDKLNELAGHLNRTDASDRVEKALGVIVGLTSAGGLDRLNTLVAEYQSHTRRVEEIGQTLRNAGAA